MSGEDAPLVALDANAFDAMGSDDPSGLARAFKALLDTGRIRVVVPSGVAAEAAHPNAPPEIRSAVAARSTVTRRPRVTAEQQIDRIRVRAIMRGDGRPGKHDADAAHLSEAAEAGCRYFVTADGKILRRRDTLHMALPASFRIVTLAELVADLREGG